MATREQNFLQVASGVYNVKHFGAKGDGTTDDTTAIAAAIAAVPSGGGRVLFPPGTYLANVAISARDDLTLEGVGTASKIKPASGTALALTNTHRIRVDNLMLEGSGGGAKGLTINGASRSFFSRLYVNDFSGDGIEINGDGSTEIMFVHTYVADCDGVGFEYNRTTADDTGGLYLQSVTVVKGSGAGTAGLKFASSIATSIFLVADGVVADGYTDRAFILDTVSNWRIGRLYATGTIAAKGIVYFNAASQGVLEQVWCQNASTTGYIFEFNNACSNIMLDDLHLVGSTDAATTAFRFVTTNHANIRIGKYLLQGTATPTLTNSGAHWAALGNAANNKVQPFNVFHDGGSANCLVLEDINGGSAPKKYFRINSSELQIVNNAFGAVIWTLNDGGDMTLGRHLVSGGTAPAIAAGTGAGTSPTVSVSGNDTAGVINVTTGSGAPAADATIVTITFQTAYGATPKAVILTPANKATQALAVTVAPFADQATLAAASFIVKSNGTGLATATAYQWFYQVIG